MFTFLKLFFDEVEYNPETFNESAEADKFVAKVAGSEEVAEEEVTKDTKEANEEVTEEETTEEVVEEEVTKDTKETDEETTEEETTEEVVDETASETLQKRFDDTQSAYHAGQEELKALREKVKKYEEDGVDNAKENPEALTLKTIDPKTLNDSWAKDPINTMRWITDQQAKMTFESENTRLGKEQRAVEREDRVKVSEEAALDRYPVLGKIIKMQGEELQTFLKESPEQYEFAQKTLEYQDVFEKRGDEEALYNAASRAFAELSPKALEKIKANITKAVTTAQQNKKTTVKQAAVSSGKGTTHNKQDKKHSESEFFSLGHQEQQDVMYNDFQRKLASLNK